MRLASAARKHINSSLLEESDSAHLGTTNVSVRFQTTVKGEGVWTARNITVVLGPLAIEAFLEGFLQLQDVAVQVRLNHLGNKVIKETYHANNVASNLQTHIFYRII